MSSSPDPAFSNVEQEQEPGQLLVFRLNHRSDFSHVVLQTDDDDPVFLPRVPLSDFTLHGPCDLWRLNSGTAQFPNLLSQFPNLLSPYELPIDMPISQAISFLFPVPSRLATTTLEEMMAFDSGEMMAFASEKFDHGKVKERINFIYGYNVVSMTWLHVFSLLPGYHPVVKLLLAQGADPNSLANFFMQTPLHMAKTPEIAKVLIDNKAEVNVKDRWGLTPLHLASHLDRHSIVEVLVAHGADVFAVDSWGETPLSRAKSVKVILTLIEHTRDLNKQYHQTGNTQLHCCSEHGNEEAVIRLLQKGARLDVKNNKGETVLDIARAMGYAHVASHFPGHLRTGRFKRDFEVVEDDKHKGGILGEGAFGRVFKVRSRGTDYVYAIKEIPFPPEEDLRKKTLMEVDAAMELSRLNPYILTHHDAWFEDRRTSDEQNESSETSSSSQEESDDVIRFEETGRSDQIQHDESSGTSSSSQEESDDVIRFEETGQNDQIQNNCDVRTVSSENVRITTSMENLSPLKEPLPSDSVDNDDIVEPDRRREETYAGFPSPDTFRASVLPSAAEMAGFHVVEEPTFLSDFWLQSFARKNNLRLVNPPGMPGDCLFEAVRVCLAELQGFGPISVRYLRSLVAECLLTDDIFRITYQSLGEGARTFDDFVRRIRDGYEYGTGICITALCLKLNIRIGVATFGRQPYVEGNDGPFIMVALSTAGQGHFYSLLRGTKAQNSTSVPFQKAGASAKGEEELVQGNRNQHPTRSSAQSDGCEDDISLSTGAAREQYLEKCRFTLYIQMDLMEMTLEDYIRRRNEGYLEKKSSALSEEDRWTAWRIFLDLRLAVEFVHDRGFIHRDLKPSNVLLSPNENPTEPDEGPYSVRLSDFGLSTRLVDEFGGMYKTVGCGTVSYAAPEQLKGGPGSTSKRAKYGKEVDVYSLALIAVELAMPMSISGRVRLFNDLRSPEVRIPKEAEVLLDEEDWIRVLRISLNEAPRAFSNHKPRERPLDQLRRALSHEPTERPTMEDLRFGVADMLRSYN